MGLLGEESRQRGAGGREEVPSRSATCGVPVVARENSMIPQYHRKCISGKHAEDLRYSSKIYRSINK